MVGEFDHMFGDLVYRESGDLAVLKEYNTRRGDAYESVTGKHLMCYCRLLRHFFDIDSGNLDDFL